MEPTQQAPRQNRLARSLPIYLTRFVGREQESATLTSLLLSKRLLTLVGTGGIGKTRLALHIANALSTSFADGVYLIELGSLADPQLVPQTIGSVLNIRTNQDTPIIMLLQTALKERHLLLILDTCEHILLACAQLVEDLLQACPQLHILATSREPLHITGESVWRITPLSSPHPEKMPPFEQLANYEAIQLFCERATDFVPRFQLTPQNAASIVHICHQLDGLPMALELAAARLPMLSVDQLAARLNERFQLLSQNQQNIAERMKTLQATLDWSYTLLTPAEQTLFPCLAIFVGSWDLAAVEEICAGVNTASYPVFDILAHLVNKSLVIAEEQENPEDHTSEIRYRLLDTVQQYALQKLQQTENWQRLCEQHYAWYLHLAERANQYLRGKEQVVWLQLLEREQANLRIALTRMLEAGHLAEVTRLGEALERFWVTHNYFSEGRHWFESILRAANKEQQLPPALRARVLFGAAKFARYQGANEHAASLIEEQIALLQTLDDPLSLAEAQAYLGLVTGLQGEYKRGAQLCQAALAIYRKAEHQAGITTTLITLAFVALSQGNYLYAIELSEEASQALREVGDHAYLLYALFTLAQAVLTQGELDRARKVCKEALQLAQTLRQTYGVAASLGLIGGIAGLDGQAAQGARLFGAAQALQNQVQAFHPPAGRAQVERMVLSIRTTLGKEQFNLHYAAGMASPLEQILQEAEAVLQKTSITEIDNAAGSATTAVVPAAFAGLSQREREILALTATGLSDIQIAQQLFLSPRTVSKHLQSIYTKLHVNSRTAATRIAIEHGLI